MSEPITYEVEVHKDIGNGRSAKTAKTGIKHPNALDSEKEKHSPNCKWHKDWHACDCGIFDKEREE